MLTAPQRAALLVQARALILFGWTQHAYVRSSAGYAVAIDAKHVRRVCGAGAVDRVGAINGLDFAERDQLRAELIVELLGDVEAPKIDDLALERWNDTEGRTRAEVLALYDSAIARLSAGVAVPL